MKEAIGQPEYPAFLAALKERILQARSLAAIAVNRELVALYWDIGQGIAEKQSFAGWGDSVVERLAGDLRSEFPDMQGFSIMNVWRMRQLYLIHTADDFLSQAVRELGISRSEKEKLSQTVRVVAILLIAQLTQFSATLRKSQTANHISGIEIIVLELRKLTQFHDRPFSTKWPTSEADYDCT